MKIASNTMNDLYRDVLEALSMGPHSKQLTGTGYGIAHAELVSKLEFDYDLRMIGFTALRWTRFLRDYTDVRLHAFLEQAERMDRGKSLVYSLPDYRRHTHGPCFCAVTVNRVKAPYLTCYSRTTNWGRTAVVDLAFIYALSKELTKRIPELRRSKLFRWLVDVVQIRTIDALLGLYQSGLLDEVLRGKSKFCRAFKAYHDKYISGSRTIKFASARRVIQRFERIKSGELKGKPLPVETLPVLLDEHRGTLLISEDEGVTPEDLVPYVGECGREIRDYLRECATQIRAFTYFWPYIWTTRDDPTYTYVMRHFGIELDRAGEIFDEIIKRKGGSQE